MTSIRECDLCLPAHYREGARIRGDGPVFRHDLEVVRQPAVYPFVAHLARRFECSAIVDLGVRDAARLAILADEFDIVGLGAGATIAAARERCPRAQWLEWDLESDPLPLPVDRAAAAVVCSNVLEHLGDPSPLLHALVRLAEQARLVVISSAARGSDDLGPPDDPVRVREWRLDELERLVEASGASVELSGLTLTADRSPERTTSLVVLGGNRDDGCAPAELSAVAFVLALNEADVAGSTIEHLLDEGVGVYLLDNWSTDGTWELAQSFVGRGVVGIERFPPEGPSPHHEWRRLLGRIEELAATMRADWFVLTSTDERRESPWPGLSLRDAFWRVERRGFNAVDHTVLTFPPVDDGFRPGTDPEAYFRHFEFGRGPGHYCQINAWKRTAERVDLAGLGGHRVLFPGQRVFPFNFLLKHYPIRSQAHGERKVFRERLPRYLPEARAGGWHVHYDAIRPGHRFVRDAATLTPFEEQDFARRYVVERLTRVGIGPPDPRPG